MCSLKRSAWAGLDREATQPIPSFFNGDDGTRSQGFAAFTENLHKPRDHRARRLVLESDKNHAWKDTCTQRQKIGKVEIARDNQTRFPASLFEDERIGQALKAFFAQMPDVVTALTKGLDRAER